MIRCRLVGTNYVLIFLVKYEKLATMIHVDVIRAMLAID